MMFHWTKKLQILSFIAILIVPSIAISQETDPFAPTADQTSFDDTLPLNEDNFAFGENEEFSFEKSPEELQEEYRKEAFDAALEGLLPLRPQEIRTLLERYDRTQESVSVPVHPNPKPEVTVQNVPLDPGTKPVSVKVSYGHVSTINILDSSGAPWPIEDITWAGDFQVIEAAASSGTNVLRVTPQSEFAFGNMSMKLVGLQTPVIMVLETSRDIVHYRFDAIIPGNGPNGKAPIIQTGVNLTAGDSDMTSILEGITPAGAQRLNVSGVDSRTSAYRFNGLTVLRTPFDLLSPAWEASVSSADGTNVYAFREAPVVLLSENGKMTRARITARESALGDIFDE